MPKRCAMIGLISLSSRRKWIAVRKKVGHLSHMTKHAVVSDGSIHEDGSITKTPPYPFCIGLFVMCFYLQVNI